MSAIVIDTSALLDAAARAAVVRLSAASRLELALVALNAPLLFKGDDFAATDVALALES